MKIPDIFPQYYAKAQDLLQNINTLQNHQTLDKADVMPLLYKLSYITENFITDEELFLRKHNYPDLEIHKQENCIFINKLKEINKLWHTNPRETLLRLFDLFSKWAESHPNGMDKRVEEFIKRNS